MNNIKEKAASYNWDDIRHNIHTTGYRVLQNFLTDEECYSLIDLYDDSHVKYRKKVIMERYRFGFGEYKYFDYPLPTLIQKIRETLYPYLTPIANLWMKVLRIDRTYPDKLVDLLHECAVNDQLKPTPLILKYSSGGFNTLHQDLYGDLYFPLQAVLFLSEPDHDYYGGEFVITEQIPRAQSKAIVLRPKKGDLLIFSTNFRPVKGTKGYYRVNMKHGVSEVHSGKRCTLGIIFHDAKN